MAEKESSCFPADQTCFPVDRIRAEDLSPQQIELVVAQNGHRLFQESRLDAVEMQPLASSNSSQFTAQGGWFGL